MATIDYRYLSFTWVLYHRLLFFTIKRRNIICYRRLVLLIIYTHGCRSLIILIAVNGNKKPKPLFRWKTLPGITGHFWGNDLVNNAWMVPAGEEFITINHSSGWKTSWRFSRALPEIILVHLVASQSSHGSSVETSRPRCEGTVRGNYSAQFAAPTLRHQEPRGLVSYPLVTLGIVERVLSAGHWASTSTNLLIWRSGSRL